MIEENKKDVKKIEIVRYNPRYQADFKRLNQEWITRYFVMEEIDYLELDHPEEYVIDKGGEILIALLDDLPAGVCALVRMDDLEYDFELSKLAVAPEAQGIGIGRILVQAVIDLAKEKGGQKLFLQSNTILKPAIHLYYKMGFKEVSRPSPLYDRVNIQMELIL